MEYFSLMKMFNFTQGMSSRRTGLAIARGIGWTLVLGATHGFAVVLNCSYPGPGYHNSNGLGIHYPAFYSGCGSYFGGQEQRPILHINDHSKIYASSMTRAELWSPSNTYVDNSYINLGVPYPPGIILGGCADISGWGRESSIPTLTANGFDFNAYTEYCGYFKTSTHVITLEATTGASATSEWESGGTAKYIEYNRSPVSLSSNSATVAENDTYVLTLSATDQDSDPVSFSILSGGDATAFVIDSSTDVLSFASPPDFESKNSYSVNVGLYDGINTIVSKTITVTVTDVDESQPVTAPPITSPTPGTTLTGDTETITWTTTPGATHYQIQAGSSAGRNDYYDSGALEGTATSEPLVNLPTNGSTIYVTVSYKEYNQTWKSDPYEFTAFDDGGAGGSSTPPEVTSHTDGGALTSATETFTWSDVGADNYWLQIGSSAGRNDHYDSGQLAGTVTSQEVSDLPGDGTSIIHVRIWYKNNGRWEYIPDTNYTAATVAGGGAPTLPSMTSPSTGTSLSTATQTFTWSAVSDSNKYWLQIGTSPGRNDYYDSSELAAATDDASDLPTGGSEIHVRVWAFIGGRWVYDDFLYNEILL